MDGVKAEAREAVKVEGYDESKMEYGCKDCMDLQAEFMKNQKVLWYIILMYTVNLLDHFHPLLTHYIIINLIFLILFLTIFLSFSYHFPILSFSLK